MKRSTERILTTHVGSLPRPADLADLMIRRDEGEAVAEPVLAARVASACAEAVARQVDAGLDIVNDGELGKPSFVSYLKDRLSGYDGPESTVPNASREPDFPNFRVAGREDQRRLRFPYCTGPVAVRDVNAVQRDIAILRAAVSGRPDVEVFMTSISPGQVVRSLPNRYYASDEEYAFAVAAAMSHEYRAIVGAGFILQLDCPDLASGRNHLANTELGLEEWRRVALTNIEALNGAIAGLPADRIRLHVCWGNYEGPHVRDVPLRDIIDVLLTARVGALSVEAANPRHAHEWKLFETIKLPEGMVLIPGVIDSCTNYVEHSELVCERLVRYGRLLGRENVIGGVDCGFSTHIGSGRVHPEVVWAKLATLAEGARLASRELWA
jgi:5-methyltetrahydropteroyltriglutamate--homocysteine methyltransferase